MEEQRKDEIVSEFRLSFKPGKISDTKQFTLAELREADEMIGRHDWHEGYRIRMRNRISDLVHRRYWAVQITLALIAGGVLVKVLEWLFSL
jgi:hypothetical protein